MAFKLKDKNPLLQGLIGSLGKKQEPIWKAVAKGLGRKGSNEYTVDMVKLERHAKDKETIVVPGIVLGTGELSKKLTVAAWRFSATGKAKIEKSGGKCLEIEELVKQNPKGSGVRIMG